MLSWIIQIAIISIILIFLVHHIILFFKSTLTVPKIKDLVNSPTKKYENIYNIINKNSSNSILAEDNNKDYTLIDLLPIKNDDSNMKNELKHFLKSQLHSSL
jgi:flagellar basal body-associated protein FliL